jgi:hypothetical protein
MGKAELKHKIASSLEKILASTAETAERLASAGARKPTHRSGGLRVCQAVARRRGSPSRSIVKIDGTVRSIVSIVTLRKIKKNLARG